MARVTFLSAVSDQRLVKTFTDAGSRSYPRVKRVSSHTYDDVTDPQVFGELLQHHAELGHCLLKGHPDVPLVEESRKGRVDRDQPTGFLALDFDGINTDEDMTDVSTAAEYLIARLPPRFHDVSYVAQASASFGRNPARLALHLFFLLQQYTHPRALREYVTSLNFDGGFFFDRLKLSATGSALSYPIDRTIADNARIIYIAPPQFEGTQIDPISADKRIVFVPKATDLLDLDAALDAMDPELTERKSRRHILNLRKRRGLPPKVERIRTMIINDMPVPVVSNPDRMTLTPAEDCGDYVRYNVNQGDSNAYWVHKNDPQVVYNFKGEPNFLFERADSDSYHAHLLQYPVVQPPPEIVLTPEGYQPLVFLDYRTAKHHYGLYDTHTKRMESLHQCGANDYRHFLTQYGSLVPDTVPVWRYEFEPHNPVLVDPDSQFINRYDPPDHITQPVEIPPEYMHVKMGGARCLEQLCPTTWKLMISICGDGYTELEYFINWLAFAFQRKEKAMTAWVFHGVPGTGKGLFFHNVLAPLFGERYAVMKRTQDLEEKFNGWMAQTLLFVVDELRLPQRPNQFQVDLINKLKNIITEPTGTIRTMGVDQKDAKFYANCIFFSNDDDAIPLQDGDRRFNVAPRQEIPLIRRHPELLENGKVKIDCAEELPRFSTFLMNFEYDQMAVILPLENEAKQEMREATRDSVDMFIDALLRGDLDYFVPIMDEKPRTTGEDYTLAAQNLMRAIIRDYDPETEHLLFADELRVLFNVLCGKADNLHKFGKMLAHHGMKTYLLRRGDIVKRGIRVRWKANLNAIETLRSLYVTEQDRRYAEPRPEREQASALH